MKRAMKGLAISLVLGLLPLWTQTTASAADWYNPGWSYRRPITINNTGNASTLTDYQVRISVTYDSDMKSNFSDLRFTDSNGTSILSYWVETYTASTSAVVWAKVPSIPGSSTKTIYMYYDNAAANSESSGDATLEFFDDFSGDLSKWTVEAGSAVIESGEVKLSGLYGALKTAMGDAWTNYEAQIKSRKPNDNNAYGLSVFYQTPPKGYWFRIRRDVNDWYCLINLATDSNIYANYTMDQSRAVTSWMKVQAANEGTQTRIRYWESNNSVDWYTDSDTSGQAIDSSGSRSTGGRICLHSNDGIVVYYDDVRVRKFSSPDPTASIGSEEAVPTPTPTVTPTNTPTRTPTQTPTPIPTPTKNMNPPGPPSAGSGMYTLSQIYDYLNLGVKATPVPSFREPGAGPGPTMKTVKEIYEDIQAKFDQCDVTAANVDSGKKFFSTLPGSWGVRTGTR
ncbi:MAG: DUF2341 domain-containing protein [Candidatus Aureabacteria bacterium]|nr:DUF2341 domain-containing protein [Candidatus Auribacterota bacterium]